MQLDPLDSWDAMRYLAIKNIFRIEASPKEPNYISMLPNFHWAPIKTIKETFKASTQFVLELLDRVGLCHSLKSANPALNIPYQQESVATNMVFLDTPAIDDGSMYAQIFVRRKSLVTDVYGMKTDQEFVNILEDNIRKRGAMNKLISDRAKAEVSS